MNRVPDAFLSEARQSVTDALDLLGLTGTPREAVKPLLIAATSTGAEAHILKPQTFWFG